MKKESVESNSKNDKDSEAISNIAEVVFWQNKGSKSQKDIEEQIQESYKKMQAEIDSRLAPIITKLTEVKADPGLINRTISGVKETARTSFFNKIISTDITKIEEVKDSAKSDAIKFILPVDGFEVLPGKVGATKANNYLMEYLNQKEESTPKIKMESNNIGNIGNIGDILNNLKSVNNSFNFWKNSMDSVTKEKIDKEFSDAQTGDEDSIVSEYIAQQALLGYYKKCLEIQNFEQWDDYSKYSMFKNMVALNQIDSKLSEEALKFFSENCGINLDNDEIYSKYIEFGKKALGSDFQKESPQEIFENLSEYAHKDLNQENLLGNFEDLEYETKSYVQSEAIRESVSNYLEENTDKNNVLDLVNENFDGALTYLIESINSQNISDQEKDIKSDIKKIVIKRFEQEKDNEFYNDEYTNEKKKIIFRSIIEEKVPENGQVNISDFEELIELDSYIFKEALDEVIQKGRTIDSINKEDLEDLITAEPKKIAHVLEIGENKEHDLDEDLYKSIIIGSESEEQLNANRETFEQMIKTNRELSVKVLNGFLKERSEQNSQNFKLNRAVDTFSSTLTMTKEKETVLDASKVEVQDIVHTFGVKKQNETSSHGFDESEPTR